MTPKMIDDRTRDRLAAQVAVDFPAACRFLAELVRIPTDNPPGDCAAHALKAAALLRELGFEVEEYPVPEAVAHEAGMISATNLIVRQRFGEGGPCIALNAHGDVVPPGRGWTQDPYGAAIVDDPQHGPVMLGRGVAVSKSDFATYTYALLALKNSPPPVRRSRAASNCTSPTTRKSAVTSARAGCSSRDSASPTSRSARASPTPSPRHTTAACIWK